MGESTALARGKIAPLEIGYVKEMLEIAARSGVKAAIEVRKDADPPEIEISIAGTEEAINSIDLGGLSWRVDLPTSKAVLHDGRIERYALPDHYYEGRDRVAYWGHPQDLVVAGIVEGGRVQRGKNRSKAGASRSGKWHCYFAPSGRVLYTLSTAIPSEQDAADEAYRAAIIAGEDLGVIREEIHHGTRWKGTKAALIECGICQERHFPIAKNRLAYGGEDGRPGVAMWQTRAILNGHFEHAIHWADDYLREHPRDAPKKEQRAQTASDPNDFAERCETFFDSMCETIVELISGDMLKSEALRYDRTTVDKVRAALDHAGQLLQSASPVLPRAFAEREERAAAAKNDDAFSAFLQRALEKPKGRGARP